ncbi:MAG: nucleotide exchange factor GrpE [Candidatus Micrarchaeota archaeon]|nr:nucleotide exchange factor GrpE [Candidatus Micrarchaeota archaeon]
MGDEEKKENGPEKTDEAPANTSDGVQELTDHLKRLQAEFENYKKRVQKETAETKQRSKEQLLCELLPIIDEFELALKHPDDETGIELVHKKMVSFLRSHGVECIECVGKKFDPEMHNATEMKEGENDGAILEEIRKGYVCNGRVLRHADVCVSKKDEKKETKGEEEPKKQPDEKTGNN